MVILKQTSQVIGNNIPKENTCCTCIVCITIDSVTKMNKKIYPLNYLEECKYEAKKINTPRFKNIELELESDSEPDIETDLE